MDVKVYGLPLAFSHSGCAIQYQGLGGDLFNLDATLNSGCNVETLPFAYLCSLLCWHDKLGVCAHVLSVRWNACCRGSGHIRV